MYKLCICIPTLNRAGYIGETLDSIVPELGDDVEVVIADGGSRDDTEAVVARYRERYPAIRYFRRSDDSVAPSNAGFDRDCSWAVELAQATYCWLMTDDDVLLPGAVRQVVDHLDEGHDLIVTSAEIRDEKLQNILQVARPELSADRVFQPGQWEQFFSLAIMHLTFVGAVVIRRSIWMSRHPEAYFGSGFVHVGVAFSARMENSVLVIARPLVSIRTGNGQWSARAFKIFMFDWPQLIWSFPDVSDAAKGTVSPREPWRSWRVLFLQRAYGRYSADEYKIYLRDRLPFPLSRMVARCIASTPKFLLYVPARIYGHFRHRDPRFFVRTLNEGMRRRESSSSPSKEN